MKVNKFVPRVLLIAGAVSSSAAIGLKAWPFLALSAFWFASAIVFAIESLAEKKDG